MYTPSEVRYRHDVDELRRLADWLDEGRRVLFGTLGEPAPAHNAALDYFRLADRLHTLATQAQEYAREMNQPIP